jgi:hypothetical protein
MSESRLPENRTYRDSELDEIFTKIAGRDDADNVLAGLKVGMLPVEFAEYDFKGGDVAYLMRQNPEGHL